MLMLLMQKSSVDITYQASFDAGAASVTPEDGIGQASLAEQAYNLIPLDLPVGYVWLYKM